MQSGVVVFDDSAANAPRRLFIAGTAGVGFVKPFKMSAYSIN
jgi:hypothetical protein